MLSGSECYEGGSYVLKRWRELVDESDPLVQFLPESVGSDEAVGERVLKCLID